MSAFAMMPSRGRTRKATNHEDALTKQKAFNEIFGAAGKRTVTSVTAIKVVLDIERTVSGRPARLKKKEGACRLDKV